MTRPRDRVPMTMSGHCNYPSTPEHDGCGRDGCTCKCHTADHEQERVMTDKHVLNAILTTVKRWEDDPRYSDAEAMTDVARLIDQRGRGLDALAREWRARNHAEP